MNVQQPQATYQQQPGLVNMSYNNAEKGAQFPSREYQPGYNNTQPAPQQGMYAGPPLSDKPLDANGEREWTHGICNCFGGCGTCCLAFFLPCLVYGQVKQRIDHLQKTGRPDPEYGGCGCGWPCCAYFSLSAACGLGWILQIGSRSDIRYRYRIRGGGCTDCLAAFFCHSCALTQESRELDIEEKQNRQ